MYDRDLTGYWFLGVFENAIRGYKLCHVSSSALNNSAHTRRTIIRFVLDVLTKKIQKIKFH